MRRLRPVTFIGFGRTGHGVVEHLAKRVASEEPDVRFTFAFVSLQARGASGHTDERSPEAPGGWFRYRASGPDALRDALHDRWDYLIELRSQDNRRHDLEDRGIRVSVLADRAVRPVYDLYLVIPCYEAPDADTLIDALLSPVADAVKEAQGLADVRIQPVLLGSWHRDRRRASADAVSWWIPGEDTPALLRGLGIESAVRPPLFIGDHGHLEGQGRLSQADLVRTVIPGILTSLVSTDALAAPETELGGGPLWSHLQERPARAGLAISAGLRIMWWPELAIAREEIRRRLAILSNRWWAPPDGEATREETPPFPDAETFVSNGEHNEFPIAIGEPLLPRLLDVTLRPASWAADAGDGDLHDLATRTAYRDLCPDPYDRAELSAALKSAAGLPRPSFWSAVARRRRARAQLESDAGMRPVEQAGDDVPLCRALALFESQASREHRVQSLVTDTVLEIEAWAARTAERLQDQRRIQSVEDESELKTREAVKHRLSALDELAVVEGDDGKSEFTSGWVRRLDEECEAGIAGCKEAHRSPALHISSYRWPQLQGRGEVLTESDRRPDAGIHTLGTGLRLPLFVAVLVFGGAVGAWFASQLFEPSHESNHALRIVAMLATVALWVLVVLSVWREKLRCRIAVLCGLLIPVGSATWAQGGIGFEILLEPLAWLGAWCWAVVSFAVARMHRLRRLLVRAAEHHLTECRQLADTLVSEAREAFLVAYRIGGRRICDGVRGGLEGTRHRLSGYSEVVDTWRKEPQEYRGRAKPLVPSNIWDSLGDESYDRTVRSAVVEMDSDALAARACDAMRRSKDWLAAHPSQVMQALEDHLLKDPDRGILSRLEELRTGDLAEMRERLLPASLESILDNHWKLAPYLGTLPAVPDPQIPVMMIYGGEQQNEAGTTPEDLRDACSGSNRAVHLAEGTFGQQALQAFLLDTGVDLQRLTDSLRGPVSEPDDGEEDGGV